MEESKKTWMSFDEAKVHQQMMENLHNEALLRFGAPSKENQAYGDMLMRMYTEERVRDPDVTCKFNSGETFKIKMNASQFGQDEVLQFALADVQMKVKKVYPFNWWRRLLFRLGFPYKSMELEEIKKHEDGRIEQI